MYTLTNGNGWYYGGERQDDEGDTVIDMTTDKSKAEQFDTAQAANDLAKTLGLDLDGYEAEEV